MKDILTVCKTFSIGCIVLCVFTVGCEVKDQRESPAKSPVDRQRTETEKDVDTQRSVVKSVPLADTERTDTLSEKEIAIATKIKKWLKEKNYTIFPYGVQPPHGGGAYAFGGSSASDGKVTISPLGFDTNIGASKYRLSVIGIGSAVFIFDANGELQPAK